MCARLIHSGAPYQFLGNRIVFTNWQFVNQGHFTWVDMHCNNVTVIGDQDSTEAHLQISPTSPTGIHLSVREAQREGPLLHSLNQWEKNGSIGTILNEEGCYRGWLSTGWGDLDIFAPGKRNSPVTCYMESQDGYEWKSVPVGITEWDGSYHNNILFTTRSFVGGGFSVFRDPIGEDSERYKMVAEWTQWDRDTITRYEAKYPERTDPRAKRNDCMIFLGVRGAVSPDGLRWTPIDEPLVVTHCDTQLIATYNFHLQEYVLYTRDYADLPMAAGWGNQKVEYQAGRMVLHSRRAIGCARSKDFRKFPLPEVILQADLSMKPSEVLYTNCYTTIPGAPEHHLMFPAVWDLAHHDETWLALATSYDGLLWQYVPQVKVFETAPFGSWDGGCLFAHPNLIELPNGDWALPYTGYSVPHKYPRVKASRNTGYALWPKGRLIGIEADEKGEFTTISFLSPGDHLSINALTRRGGFVRVEVIGPDGNPVKGREMENSCPLVGDCFWTPVRWKDSENLGQVKGTEISLRFDLKCAKIFGLQFDGS